MDRINKQPDMNEKQIKKAWISNDTTLISFHEVEGTELYESEETEFWEHILGLMKLGYRVQ